MVAEEYAVKNPTDALFEHLKANFRQTNPGMTQFRDDHIWVEVFGVYVEVWNAKNMRYRHKYFKQRFGAAQGPHEDALDWLKNEYDGKEQPVPKEYAV